MTGHSVYWADIEYSNLDQTESGEGGFVYAFVAARDNNSARQILIDALQKQRKTIRELRLLEEYDPKKSWDSADLDSHYLSLANSARQTDTVAFDTFYAYDSFI
jgi:hypothetical protein